MNRLVQLLALLAPFAVAGCAGPRFPALVPANGEVARASLANDLVPAHAARRVQQRWIFELESREEVATLHVRVVPPDRLDVAVLSDLGTTLGAVSRAGDAVEVSRQTSVFDEARLRALVTELEPLFLPGTPTGYSLVRFPDGTPALYREHRGLRYLRARAVPGATIRIGRKDHLLATLVVKEWKRDDAGRPTVPSRFSVDSVQGGYRAEAEVVAVEAIDG